MLRRTYLHVLSALPALPITRERTRWQDQVDTPTFKDEADMWFWYYVYSTIQKERVMSTERSRKHAVSEMDLTALSDAEARHTLERANDGELTLDDMPDQWRRVLGEIDQVKIT